MPIDTIAAKAAYNKIDKIYDCLGVDEWELEIDGGSNPENIYHNSVRTKTVLGISTDPKDRSIVSIPQRVAIPDKQPLPHGYTFGQFSELGIAIDGIPNKFIPDPFDRRKVKIAKGDTVLCHNIPQANAEMMDQLDKALGLQESSAFVLPNADGSGKMLKSEGAFSLLAQMGFTLSKVSENTARTEITTQVNQAIAKENLQGLGLPISAKVLPVKVAHGVANVPYPALSADSPSLLLLLFEILKHIGVLTGQEVKR